MVIFGERVKKARIEKGLSQAELGNLIGVTKATPVQVTVASVFVFTPSINGTNIFVLLSDLAPNTGA